MAGTCLLDDVSVLTKVAARKTTGVHAELAQALADPASDLVAQ